MKSLKTRSSQGVAALGALLFLAAVRMYGQQAASGSGTDAREIFDHRCESCHGENAEGTDRGPGLRNNRTLRSRSEDQIEQIIRNGTRGGMPAFPLPEAETKALAAMVHSFNVSAYQAKPAGDVSAGERFFRDQCLVCHMAAGRGSVNGPDLTDVGRELTVQEIEFALDDPTASSRSRSGSNCPGYTWCAFDPWAVATVRLKDGTELRGFLRAESNHDLQLQSFDGTFHLLKDTEYSQVARDKESRMPAVKATKEQRRDLVAYLSSLHGAGVGAKPDLKPIAPEAIRQAMDPKPEDWTTYNGNTLGNRRSILKQVNTTNVAKLQLQWSYTLPHDQLETTPLVSDGLMYVTGPNQVCALDSRTGHQIWCYSRPRSPADTIPGDAAKGANRGVALLGDRVFFATDNGQLLSLNRLTGGLMWEVKMPLTPGPYGATASPLIVGDLVISGIAGGEAPIRGFVVAYHAATGVEAWRFWTVPDANDPAKDTWTGPARENGGGGATWLTGSYDPETKTLFWATGNPYPDFDGGPRGGDNLYTNCVLALDPETGKLRWYFQFTPHDLHDWDATQPLVLVDTRFQNSDRKLLMQANRNGFFYVLDRTNGQLLLAAPYVKRLTWAKGIDETGRPKVIDGNVPNAAGTKTCPGARGATNWHPTAFDPATGLFYVMALEDCNIFRSTSGLLTPVHDPDNPPSRVLRAIDIQTGKIAWEVAQTGPPESTFSGVLSTAGGLVFYAETDGGIAAVDAKTGASLWHFDSSQQIRAGPMTYMVGGRQHVVIAAGGTLMAFALPEVK